MLMYLSIAIIFFVIFLIRKTIFNATREKLDNEEEKYKLLQDKYKHLLDSTEENVIDILVALPKRKSGNWIVEKRVKSGTWPFTDSEDDIKIIEISDLELSKLIVK